MASPQSALGTVIVVALCAAACTKTGDAVREPTTTTDSSPTAATTTGAPVANTAAGGPVAPITLHHDNADASTKASSPTKEGKCAADADCRMQSSYCQEAPCL